MTNNDEITKIITYGIGGYMTFSGDLIEIKIKCVDNNVTMKVMKNLGRYDREYLVGNEYVIEDNNKFINYCKNEQERVEGLSMEKTIETIKNVLVRCDHRSITFLDYTENGRLQVRGESELYIFDFKLIKK